MTDQEILKNAYEAAINANKQFAGKAKDINFHPLYKDSVEMAENISYHAVKGVFPKKLFAHRSPNETQKESEYIENNYKQLTFPVFVDYIATIGRPMGDGNWSISYKEDSTAYKTAGNTFQKYVESEIPTYKSLENYIKFILPSLKSIDANGFIAVRPKELNYIDTEEGQVLNSLELTEPTIFYYESKNVINYVHDEYYLFLSNEKSLVTHYGVQKRDGNIYELYTKDAVYFIVQQGNKVDNDFRIDPFFNHNLGKCPVHQLKGIPHLKDDKILWQSPFFYAIDLLDLVVTNGNWLQAMVNKCAFPVPVMFGSTCEFTDSHGTRCDNGFIANSDGRSVCPGCSGQGLIPRLSPLRTLLIKPTSKFEAGEEKSSLPPLQYISPELHTLEFIDKKCDSDEKKARQILKLRNKNTTVNTNNGNVTATEITDDAKGMYAFVKPISDQIFEIYDFLLEMIGKQRYGELFESPELSYPKTFDFKSPEDYLNDLSNAIKNGLPPSFIQTILMQYINAYYGDNAKSNTIFKLVVTADRLFALSQDEIKFQLAGKTIAKWESILHSSVLNFINDAIRANEKFLEKSIEDQVTELQDMAKKLAEEIDVQPIDPLKTMLP